MPVHYDVIIVGGGAVGCMVARFLSRYELKTLLIEKEADLCMGASAANTAIVHAGYDPLPGSLKSRMNVAGNAMWDQLAAELHIPLIRRGSYVVAVNAEEFSQLEVLQKNGIENGVPGLELLDAAEVLQRLPLVSPNVTGALFAPTGGVCDPWATTYAAAENAVQNGVEVLLGTELTGFQIENRRITGIKTNRGEFSCSWVINSAGLYSDTVMHMAGVHPEFKITPRRGEYYILDRKEFPLDEVLFPVPTKNGKGITVSTTAHGNILVGPNAHVVDSKDQTEVSSDGLAETWSGAQKIVPGLNMRHIISLFAGLRATGNAPCQAPNGADFYDFLIEIDPDIQGLVNLGGIESPGLTASPAIAQRLVEMLADAGQEMKPRKDWNPERPTRPHFRDLSPHEQAALVAKDPRYGRVICRCENVTEGDIVAEIHAPVPATTYDALKRRTWLGTGRCLGGFDLPRVVEILARELNIPIQQVSKRGPGSEYLIRTTKDLKENPYEPVA
jgi:glycerol-3-phosphate dehydrogenase